MYREHPYPHHRHHHLLTLVFMSEALLAIIVTITVVEADFRCFSLHRSCSLRHLPHQIRSPHCRSHLQQDRKVDSPIFLP